MNIEEDLRAKKIYQPEVGLYDPEREGVEAIPFVQMGLTDTLRVRNKAEKARVEFLSKTDMDNAEYFANVEYNNQLKYWAVVYCLSVDDEAAYKVNGLSQVENYIENYFGIRLFDVYESLALEILDSCGIELAKLSEDEREEIEDDFSMLDDGTMDH